MPIPKANHDLMLKIADSRKGNPCPFHRHNKGVSFNQYSLLLDSKFYSLVVGDEFRFYLWAVRNNLV